MESPNPPSTVVPLAVSSIFSRPGPVSGNGEGDFQIALFGKYFQNYVDESTVFPDGTVCSSSNASDCQLMSHRCQPSAGNLLRSTPTSITSVTNSCSSPAPSAVSSHSNRPGVHSRRMNRGVPVSLPCLKSSPIHLYYQNVGGMNSCANTYRLATSDCCYDIIVLTETWLNEQTLSSQVICSDYEVLRCDRSPLNSNKSTGGGVLLAHRLTHKDQAYICDICSRKFTENSSLTRHRLIHAGERSHICDICGKEFITSVKLTRHMRMHTGERPYKREICGKGYVESSSLKRHQRVHIDMNLANQIFSCDICGRKFLESKELTQHKPIHSKDREFRCEVW
ncbi:zinc finger protein 93-like [Topomyia yanbarensis]|uniref:zinc finger protein 93-like n=1 Tax=Topomyia yanbarensis TaxID=2498891 RepID=UPI00273CB452|nr:zinc finger protein 93-like [Topomyia yanbarensis]